MKKRVTIACLQPLKSSWSVTYLPYVYGTLRAYAEQFEDLAEAYSFTAPVWKLRPVDQMLMEIDDPDVMGFSVYVWNDRNSHLLAQEVKQRHPACLIVFGGPSVPNYPTDFFVRHPWVDLCVHGEGEATFARILRMARDARPDWDAVPGISYARDGRQHFTSPNPRFDRLDLPSPYLLGHFNSMFERFRADHPDRLVVAPLETTRGCPYSCAFCSWGTATMAKLRAFPLDRVFGEIDWIARNRCECILLMDANFGVLPRDIEIVEFVGGMKRRTGFPLTFTPLGMVKNQNERWLQINKVIRDNGLDLYGMNVNLSVETTSAAAQEAVGRTKTSLADYCRLAERYATDGCKLTTELVFPLPGETLPSFKSGIATLASLDSVSKNVVYPCFVLPNAPMARTDYREKWGIQTTFMSMDRQDEFAPDCLPTEAESVEVIISTSTLSEAEHAEAKAFEALVNAMELGRLMRPLRQYACKVLGIEIHDFYDRLMEWQRAHHGVLGPLWESILAAAMDRRSSQTRIQYGQSRTYDGRTMLDSKAIAYTVLCRPGAFIGDLRGFLAGGLGIPTGEVREELLRFLADTWITPGFDPEDERAYAFEYLYDWVTFLENQDATELTRRPNRVVYEAAQMWIDGGYRKSGAGWLEFALLETVKDVHYFCHQVSGRRVRYDDTLSPVACEAPSAP
jgi:hypothetical protein